MLQERTACGVSVIHEGVEFVLVQTTPWQQQKTSLPLLGAFLLPFVPLRWLTVRPLSHPRCTFPPTAHSCCSKLCLCDKILCWSIKKPPFSMKQPPLEVSSTTLPPMLFDLIGGLTEQKQWSSHEAPGGSCFTRAMKGTTVNNRGLVDPCLCLGRDPCIHSTVTEPPPLTMVALMALRPPASMPLHPTER